MTHNTQYIHPLTHRLLLGGVCVVPSQPLSLLFLLLLPEFRLARVVQVVLKHNIHFSLNAVHWCTLCD